MKDESTPNPKWDISHLTSSRKPLQLSALLVLIAAVLPDVSLSAVRQVLGWAPTLGVEAGHEALTYMPFAFVLFVALGSLCAARLGRGVLAFAGALILLVPALLGLTFLPISQEFLALQTAWDWAFVIAVTLATSAGIARMGGGSRQLRWTIAAAGVLVAAWLVVPRGLNGTVDRVWLVTSGSVEHGMALVHLPQSIRWVWNSDLFILLKVGTTISLLAIVLFVPLALADGFRRASSWRGSSTCARIAMLLLVLSIAGFAIQFLYEAYKPDGTSNTGRDQIVPRAAYIVLVKCCVPLWIAFHVLAISVADLEHAIFGTGRVKGERLFPWSSRGPSLSETAGVLAGQARELGGRHLVLVILGTLALCAVLMGVVVLLMKT